MHAAACSFAVHAFTLAAVAATRVNVTSNTDANSTAMR
jgi:hypothetical protein